MVRKRWMRGGADGSVGKGLALQAWEPEFDPWAPFSFFLKLSLVAHDYNSSLGLGRKRWADPGGSPARQPWLLDEFQASEKPSQKSRWQ